MKTRFFSVLSFAWLGLCAAEVPQGDYTYDFNRDNSGPLLWNLVGDYSSDGVSFTIDDWSGYGDLWWGNDWLGYVTGSSRGTRARIWFSETSWDGEPYAFGSVRHRTDHYLSLKVDTNNLVLYGTDYRREEERGFYPFFSWVDYHSDPVEFPLEAGNDGSWSLALNINADGYFLHGEATLTFANGKEARFSLRGRYSPGTDRSKLLLIGIGADRGSSLQITLEGSDGQSISLMRGRVAGQSVSFKPPA